MDLIVKFWRIALFVGVISQRAIAAVVDVGRGGSGNLAPQFVYATAGTRAGFVNPPLYDRDAQYQFSYDVQDPLTGDTKSHQEHREGSIVRGSYTLIDPDGMRRVVEYTADPVNGFRAVVHREPVAKALKVATSSASSHIQMSMPAPVPVPAPVSVSVVKPKKVLAYVPQQHKQYQYVYVKPSPSSTTRYTTSKYAPIAPKLIYLQSVQRNVVASGQPNTVATQYQAADVYKTRSALNNKQFYKYY